MHFGKSHQEKLEAYGDRLKKELVKTDDSEMALTIEREMKRNASILKGLNVQNKKDKAVLPKKDSQGSTV